MEIKINRDIRQYTESVFFGLSPRQFIFSVLAVCSALALYFGLGVLIGAILFSIISAGIQISPKFAGTST